MPSGFQSTAFHVNDLETQPQMHTFAASAAAAPSLAFSRHVGQLSNPETAAKAFLREALQSATMPTLVAPKVGNRESEFATIATSKVPLTGTTTVQFRQTLAKIPVFGSLVTVELDEQNGLLGINSQLGAPPDTLDPVASISAAQCIKAVQEYRDSLTKNLTDIVPYLNFYYCVQAKTWHLAFILERVPVQRDDSAAPASANPLENSCPARMNYYVDAHSGAVIEAIPGTPTLSSVVTGSDGLGKQRHFTIEESGNAQFLRNTTLNVQTFDFGNRDPETDEDSLPGAAVQKPPVFAGAAVSAHANAEEVATFMRTILLRQNIDDRGGAMNSAVNCLVVRRNPGAAQGVWENAFWNGREMVYGQLLDNAGQLMSLSVSLDVVGHEMFHGVTEKTADLQYAAQSGALNESYSDIFGILIANHKNPNPLSWNWLVGASYPQAFRDMSNPRGFDQPDHMDDFVRLPNTENADFGGVHINSGIHNKAAFNVMTSRDAAGNPLFTVQQLAAIFYLALSKQLTRNSDFSDGRRAVEFVAQTVLRPLSEAQRKLRIDAIKAAFDAVGI